MLSASALLEKLYNEHPNSYVQIGEVFDPMRYELWNFEMMRNMKKLYEEKTFSVKEHEKMPVLLTCEEDEVEGYWLLKRFLISGTKIDMKDLTVDSQLQLLFFLNRIASPKEVESLLARQAEHSYSTCSLLHVDTWVALLEYDIPLPIMGNNLTIFEKLLYKYCKITQHERYSHGNMCSLINRHITRPKYGKASFVRTEENAEFLNYLEYLRKRFHVDQETILSRYEPPRYSSSSCGPN